MRKTRAERKAELMARFEAEVDQLLDWEEENAAPTMGQVEEVVLARREAVGRAMAESVVAGQANVQPSPRVRCPTCGEEMRVKGRKGKSVQTQLGALDVERCYYYCRRCKRGFFPPR